MKYEISVEGGFANIPKNYHGDIALPEEEIHALYHMMAAKSASSNPQLRDGQLYRIKLISQGEVTEAVFDDSNIPSQIRAFIGKVAKSEQT